MIPESHKEFSPFAGHILNMRDVAREQKYVSSLVDIVCYDWAAHPEQVIWKMEANIARVNCHTLVYEGILLYNKTTRMCEIARIEEFSDSKEWKEQAKYSIEQFKKRRRPFGTNKFDLDFVILTASQPPGPPGGLRYVA